MTKAQLQARRLKAQYMVFVENRQQKEVAKILGVSEKAISNWAKEYNWHSQLKLIAKNGGLTGIMEGFFQHVEDNSNKHTSSKTKALWNKYLERLGADFTKEAVWG